MRLNRYEKLAGRVYGEVDPRDARNAVIADIKLAALNARGMVEYSTDVYILRPVDSSKGNHRIFYEINNRGNNFSFGLLNNAPAAVVNDPTTVVDAGNGFLMRLGYTIVLSGWDAGVAPGGGAPNDHGSDCEEPGRFIDRRPRARGARHRQQYDDDGNPDVRSGNPRQVPGQPLGARALRGSAHARARHRLG